MDKNVKAKCKMSVNPRDAWNQVMEAWGAIMDCDNVEEFGHCVQSFEAVCSPWPIFVNYVNATWLIPHKEKFVKTWT